MSEFAIIQHYFASDRFPVRQEVVLGIGDDGAVLEIPPGQQLVIVADTLVNGVHFPTASDAQSIGYRALAVNLSDLAAMGATPAWFTLALTLPANNPAWLAGFSSGLASLAALHEMALVGGDTTRGPLTVTVQAAGYIPKGKAITRHGAQIGDEIYLTGTIGDAAAGLAILQDRLTLADSQLAGYLQQRFRKPTPRIAIGQALPGIASSAIDISDGLLADLSHIASQSRVAAEIHLPVLPLSAALCSLPESNQALRYALAGGDDYELCFTAPASLAPEINALAKRLTVPCTRIGKIMAGTGVRCIDASGQETPIPNQGYDHFA